MSLTLQAPNSDLLPSYLSMLDEMKALGETIWDGWSPGSDESGEAFVNRLLRAETDPAPGLVRQSTWWAVLGGEVVGRISLRHELNEELRAFGGHIGYEVRPSSRRQGVAREMLAQVLRTPGARRIGRLLLTCAPDNVGSNRTILANGGVLEKTAWLEKWRRETNYYWIDLGV